MTTYWHAVGENLGLALDTVRTHKFRSFLTVLGVLIGTTTVIAVASIIAGLDTQLVQTAEQYGTRVVWVYKLQMGAPHRLTREERLRKPLSYEDAMAVKEQCPAVDEVSAALFREMGEFGLPPSTVRYKAHTMSGAQFMGVDANYLALANSSLADGRFFTQGDDLHRRDVTVIGASVVEQLFQHEDPVGKTIVVDGHPFEVVGTLNKFKGFLGDNPDDRDIFIPLWTYKKLYPAAKDYFLSAQVSPGRMDEAQDEIRGVLRRRRHVKPSEPDNFGMATAESLINEFRQIIGTVALVMVVISSIGLLVGGIGVMNIMLVSVTERTREIGVRKAVGARQRDIAWQFLLEAVVLTGSGGLAGIAVGWLLSFLVRVLVPSLPSTVPLWSVVAGFVVATSVGLFFGLWPALKAARLDPITALRYE
ncbi:MAG: ABC transporter permease [Terriglobia bacterium]|jgi:ABC-type antimicrobial peptide transport system permease subunit